MMPAPPPVPTPSAISGPVPVRHSTGEPGVYLVASLALVYSSGFDWSSIVAGTSFEIEESLGGGASLGTGWEWDNYFADIHLTYARSDLKSIDLESIDLGRFDPSFSGDTEFFGFYLTGGRKVDLLDDLKLPFGFGVGGGRQEISMMIGGVPYSESDFVLTYHLFAGLEYFATEHLLFGMQYRLANLGELTSFSSRTLQMLEFSCGYQF
jgi:opacity protein-like surface antigen